MVDKFYGIDGDCSQNGLTVHEENIFCKDGVFQECGIIEHVAQSAAFRTGYTYITKGEEVPIGFIGSVNNLTIHSLPKVGDELITEIKVETELFGITLLNAVVKSGTALVAECQMKVAIASSN